MNEIKVEHQPSMAELDRLGVHNWPIWEKEPSVFHWNYDQTETCLFVEGDVTVTPDQGQPVTMASGDLVTFPAGLSCTWEIRRTVKKHYRFG